jgi:hypothetical protein
MIATVDFFCFPKLLLPLFLTDLLASSSLVLPLKAVDVVANDGSVLRPVVVLACCCVLMAIPEKERTELKRLDKVTPRIIIRALIGDFILLARRKCIIIVINQSPSINSIRAFNW